MTQTHTPGPWRMTKHDALKNVYHIDAGPKGYERVRVAIVDTGEANAAYIVRACNAHDELLAIAKRIHGLMQSGDIEGREWSEFIQLSSAIAKAEGRA